MLDGPLVWIQRTPYERGDNKIYCTKVKYEDVTFQWCYVNVPRCTVKFNPLTPAVFDKYRTAWLVFDMEYDYNVYGPITVKGTLNGEEEDVSYHMSRLEDLDAQGHFLGRASWGRVVPIRFSAAEGVVISVTFGFAFRATTASLDEETCSLSFVFPLLGEQDEEHGQGSASYEEDTEEEEGFEVEMECDMMQPGREFTVEGLPTGSVQTFTAEGPHDFRGKKRVGNGGRMEIKFEWKDTDVRDKYFLKPVGVEANGIVALSYPFCKLDSERSKSNMVHVLYRERVIQHKESGSCAMSQLLRRIPLSDVVYLCRLHPANSKELTFVRLQGEDVTERLLELQKWLDSQVRNFVRDIEQDTEASMWIFCEGKLDTTLEGVKKEWNKYVIHVGHDNGDHYQSHNMELKGYCVVPWGASINSDYKAMLCQALHYPYLMSLKLETQVCEDFPTSCTSFNEIAYNVCKIDSDDHKSAIRDIKVQYEIWSPTEEKTKQANVTIESKHEYAVVLGHMFDHLSIIERENQLAIKKFSSDVIKEMRDADIQWKTRESLSRFVELKSNKEGRGFSVTPQTKQNKFVLCQYAWWNEKKHITQIARHIYGVLSLPEKKAHREQLNYYAYKNQTPAWQATLSDFPKKFSEETTQDWSDEKLALELLKRLPAYEQPWYEATLAELEEKVRQEK